MITAGISNLASNVPAHIFLPSQCCDARSHCVASAPSAFAPWQPGNHVFWSREGVENSHTKEAVKEGSSQNAFFVHFKKPRSLVE